MSKGSKGPDLGFLANSPAHQDLSGMFAESAGAAAAVTLIAPERLLDNPYQPRKALDPAGLADLAAVIKTQGFRGVLEARAHPARPGWYELAWGHRRRDAARLAGLATVPVIVRELAEEELIIHAITENIQRQDLTPLEEGDIFQLMIAELGYTQEQVAQEIGKDRGYVVNRLRAARAPADVRALVAAKPDSLRAVGTLVKVTDLALRAELMARLRAGSLTADDLPGYLAEATADGPDPGPTPAAALPPAAPPAPVPVAPPAARPPVRPGPPGPADDAADAQAQVRIGKSKLSTVLRVLTLYRASVDRRATISARELISLSDIKSLVDDLYARCCPEDTPGA